jgi:ATP-binding cassette, subfamily B, beta-glucan exporter
MRYREGLLAGFAVYMKFVLLYARVLKMLGPQARLGWLLACANLALAAANFAEPVLLGRIIDALASAQASGTLPSWPRLFGLIAAWIGFGLFTIGCGALVALYADRLAHRRRHAVLTSYFEHVLQLPLSFHGGSHSGRLMKIMLAGTDALWSLWLDFFRDSFAAAMSVVLLLPFTLFLNWRLGSMLIGTCIAFGFLGELVLRKTSTLQSSVERHYSDLAERASDTLGNIALVQGFARAESEVSGLNEVVDRLLTAQIPVLSWWALAAVLTRASTTLTLLLIFLVGIWLHLHGHATIGDIVMFMNFAGMLITQLEKAVHFANRLSMDAPRLQEFFDVLDTEPAVRNRPDAIDPGRVRGLVEFKDVSYSHDGKRPAVVDLTFTALPGETIALVGPTGAGKSTALALLHRAFDPQSGTIMIDGMDLRALDLSALRRNIGVVFQEALLLNRSIAENLRVAKPEATDDEMRDALTRAQALDFVESNPEGLESNVGERGRSLSGGERQRLSIARALLKDPPILILDEATSALDAATEVKIQAALDEVMKNRTTFVIAHRLSTIRNATRILVFDAGRIVETGTFDELIAQGGRFAKLAKAQFMTGTKTGPRASRPSVAKSGIG